MSNLRNLGDLMFDNEGPSIIGTIGLAALMTWSFQGAIDDNDWDMGTENSDPFVQEFNQKMAKYSTVETEYKAAKNNLEVEQKELDLLKDLDENRNGEWAYDSEKTKDHMWSSHVFSNKTDDLKGAFKETSSALGGEVRTSLLTNMNISEQQYMELGDALDDKTSQSVSQYGVMLRECQLEYMDDTGLTTSEKADEINGCMKWENAKDVLDWAIIFPFLVLGGLGMFAAKEGLHSVDKAVQKNAKKQKKKDIKPN